MKLTSLLPPAAAVGLIAAAVLAANPAVQATQDHAQTAAPASSPAAQSTQAPSAAGTPQPAMAPGGQPMRNYPPPTNLKVLPKNLTGREVHEIMEKWAGSLGVHCDTCHVADPNNIGPNGRPRLNFPDDSKPDKQIARIMYTMTQQVNTDYISKAMDLDAGAMGMPVTCGTCHRGHKMPEEFVIPPEGPSPGAMPPAGSAPAAGTPPATH
ncbi:MAG: c-type cytochrome [Terracidiphilus sp.]